MSDLISACPTRATLRFVSWPLALADVARTKMRANRRASLKPADGTSRRNFEDAHDRRRDLAPLTLLARQLGTAGLGERVEPRLPVVVRHTPVGFDETALLEPLQRGIQRAVLDDQDIVGLR